MNDPTIGATVAAAAMKSMSNLATATPPRLRILMLHGYTQNGDLFRAKVRALEKHFLKAFPHGVDFVYPTGPVKLRVADIPVFGPGGATAPTSTAQGNGDGNGSDDDEGPNAFGWWTKRPQAVKNHHTDVLEHLDECFDAVATVLKRDGPFDGIVGFSQGAALAAMVAGLLEPGRDRAFSRDGAGGDGVVGGGDVPPIRFPASFFADDENEGTADTSSSTATTTTATGRKLIHPPVRFVVAYSGFRILSRPYTPFYSPKITTPVMSVIGSNDSVVAEERSLALADACVDGDRRPDRLLFHPGGHFVPSSQRQVVVPVLAFVKAHL